MQLVQKAALMPGQCALIPSATGPFVDTLRVDTLEHRLYVSLEAFNELERVFREEGVKTVAAVTIARLEAIVSAQAELIDELRKTEGELEQLKRSVRFTLEAGRGAVQTKGGEQKLRSLPGQKRVEL